MYLFADPSKRFHVRKDTLKICTLSLPKKCFFYITLTLCCCCVSLAAALKMAVVLFSTLADYPLRCVLVESAGKPTPLTAAAVESGCVSLNDQHTVSSPALRFL